MPQIINTNIMSLNSQRNLNSSQTDLQVSLQRLSSGLRINSAKDDAAGLAISERFTTQIRGLNQAVRNANDGISLAQTAEGALAELNNNLQRIRELAVQSVNATNSDSDRAALNQEVQQRLAEIDRIAAQTAFNGQTILDGSFSNMAFQIGANVGEVISLGTLSSVRTRDLAHQETSYISSQSGSTVAGALSSGDLVLNGQTVGASTDGTAAGQGSTSAYAIAAAINAVSTDSGVSATASTIIVGNAPTNYTEITAGTFSINGAAVGTVAAGGNAVSQGGNLAQAINAVSGGSGVTASVDSATGAVTLTAADGRDIVIGLLGSAIDEATATTNRTTFLAQTGLPPASVGTQAVDVTLGAPQVIGDATGGVFLTLPSGAAAAGTVSDLMFSINGGGLIALPDLVFTTDAIANSHTLRNAIEALAPGYVGQFSGQLFITGGNTIQFAIAGIAPDTATADATRDALTAMTGLTTAQLGSQAVAGAGAAAVDATTKGSVSLQGSTEQGIDIAGNNPALAGLTTETIAATASTVLMRLDSVTVATASSANEAITVVDAALTAVSSLRSTFGAIQNRFESTIANLGTTVENLTASRSRIQDTDFAAETANLTRAQILQQAGVAMLAQANQLPQNVLSLLR